MQQLHLQEEEALKSQRVTEAEAQQIVHLWAETQKQAATHSGPTVHDIAEGLEIPPEEALRLLKQVRETQEVQAQTRVRTRKHAPMMIAVAVMALVAVMLMGMLVVRTSFAPTIAPVASPVPFTPVAEPPSAVPGQPTPVAGEHPTTGLPR